MMSTSRVRKQLTSVGVVFAIAAALCATTAWAAPPLSLHSLKPTPAPAGWRLLLPESSTSALWYPPSMRRYLADHDPYSVTVVLQTRNGADLLYLNAGPKTGPERMSNWPSFRIAHVRADHNRWAHEDGRAFGVPFLGGHGSCVVDDYLTIVRANHYREIACFVQGRRTASVIVAATLAKDWRHYRSQLVRAVEAFEVL